MTNYCNNIGGIWTRSEDSPELPVKNRPAEFVRTIELITGKAFESVDYEPLNNNRCYDDGELGRCICSSVIKKKYDLLNIDTGDIFQVGCICVENYVLRASPKDYERYRDKFEFIRKQRLEARKNKTRKKCTDCTRMIPIEPDWMTVCISCTVKSQRSHR